jgi:hypothetical protein
VYKLASETPSLWSFNPLAGAQAQADERAVSYPEVLARLNIVQFVLRSLFRACHLPSLWDYQRLAAFEGEQALTGKDSLQRGEL